MACTSGNVSTQNPSVSKGRLVGAAVNVGFVGVGDSVLVEVGDAVTVAVNVAGLGVLVVVADGGIEGVIVGVTTGLGRIVKTTANNRMIPRITGMTNLRIPCGMNKVDFLNGATSGGSPLYPRAPRRFLKFSSYSPNEKFA